jgi:hypothetical protein
MGPLAHGPSYRAHPRLYLPDKTGRGSKRKGDLSKMCEDVGTMRRP